MIIKKIETPSWNGYIKAILSRYPLSFQFKGIQDNYLLDFYEWWAIKNNDGLVLGIGWIDISQDTFGEVEAEISICVNTTSQGANVGSTLLSFLEEEVIRRGINLIAVVVKKSNPEHENVTNWFIRRGYESVLCSDTSTYMIKKNT